MVHLMSFEHCGNHSMVEDEVMKVSGQTGGREGREGGGVLGKL